MSKILETSDKMSQHEYGKLVQPMEGEEYNRLKAGIEADGQFDAGTVCYADDGSLEVLDGWHRYKACQSLGIPFKCEVFKGDDTAKLRLVMSRYNRRHSDKNTVGKTIAQMLKAHAALVEAGKMSEAEATEEIAKATGASKRTVDRNKRVLSEADPELSKAVEEGEIPVGTAESLLKEDKETQREIARNVMKEKGKGKATSARKKAKKVKKAVKAAKGSKDDARQPIPACLKAEFAEGETYQQLHQLLGKAWKTLRNITKTSGGWVTKGVHDAIGELISTVKANRPAYVCQVCQGTGEPQVKVGGSKKCPRCTGTGYIRFNTGQKPVWGGHGAAK